MNFRLYKPEDRATLVELFQKQGVDAHLPIPEEDPCVLVATVAEHDGKPVSFLIGRLTLEMHYIVSPDQPDALSILSRLKARTEGAIMVIARQMKSLGFAAIEDVIAFVPSGMVGMRKAMHYLGFTPEPDEAKGYWKRLGT